MTDAERELAARLCSELYAQEMRAALQAAVDGAPHWRIFASVLLHKITDLQEPGHEVERVRARWRELDELRRKSEVMDSIVKDHAHA